MKKIISLLMAVLCVLAAPACSAGNSATQEENKSLGTRANPYPMNKTAFFDGMATAFDTYKAEITALESVRGQEAWTIIQQGNPLNAEPDEGMEYMLVKFKIKVLESQDNIAINFHSVDFDFVSNAGIQYSDFISLSGIETFTTTEVGEETIGYAYTLIDPADQPTIVFFEKYNNGLWFATQ